MFKVECPGCKAPYQVDERRVPSTGLKMRCPKCGTSFKVDPPSDGRRTGPSPVLGNLPEKAPPAARPDVDLPSPVQRPAPPRPPAGPPRPAAKPAAPEPAPPRVPPPEDPYGEVDLPAVGRKSSVPALELAELPAVPARGAGMGAMAGPEFGEIELPAPAPARDRREIGLPAAIGGNHAGEFGEIDLPMRSGSAAGRTAKSFAAGTEVDLPAVGRGSAGGIDLPTPRGNAKSAGGFGEIDLPVAARTGLPGLSQRDLPAVGGPGLPSPARSVDLPAHHSRADLPAPAAGLPLAVPGGGSGLPSPAGAGLPANRPDFGAEWPGPGPAGPGPSQNQAADEWGELELPGASNPPQPPFAPPSESAEADLWDQPPPLGDPVIQRQAGGGTSYGEVNLEGPPASAAPLPAAEDDMEFGAIPQEAGAGNMAAPAAAHAPVPLHAPLPGSLPQAELPRRRRGLRLLLGALVLVVLCGGALALVPTIGPFGWYWMSDRFRAGEYQALLEDAAKRSRESLAHDAYPDAREALGVIDQARAGAKRVKGLAAYAAFVGYLRELRFGAEPEVRARSQVLLDELADEKDVPHLELAQAARAAVTGQLARARQQLTGMAAKNPRNIDVLVLRGEVELRAREPKAALEAWNAAHAIEHSARSAFGLARAHYAAGAAPLAEKQAEATLAANPEHVGAKILLARIGWRTRDREAKSIEMLEQIFHGGTKASPEEIVNAQTLLGDIHLSRSRVTHAENAYAEALKINPKAARALTGLGDTMYRAGRYSEALARFEAAVQADPDDLMAMVGVAKTKLALERLQDARSMLDKLRQTHPKSMLVNYWHGQVLEALGNRKDAEQAYRTSVREGGSDPEVVSGYVALALLLNQQGRTQEAQKALDEASAKLPSSPAIHKALGELALSQGRYESAVAEYRSALALDADDLGAKFKLGSALRRDQKFNDANKVLDEVAAIDRDYPGLALERGLLFEASGQTEEALKAYESALAKAPNDPDLMLRVGCGKVTAGRAAQAESLLRKVLSLRPNSAETNHCLGRALLVEGKNLAEALRMFERSIDLDPHRAEYWLYLGWAANEAGRVAKADEALKKALELDQGLGDAYWQRGVLRARQGAVKDAINDLTKALELRPSRHEAHAALAEAYYGLSREPEALSEWQKAVAAQPDNGTWRFRYGKLLAANNRDEAARAELTKALELVEGQDPRPRWVWEAHHLLARALGARPEAAKHWKAFLTLGPHDSAYRDEAKSALRRLGQPWDGD